MTPASDTQQSSPTFLEAVRRIEGLTHEIQRDGLAALEKAESAYAEIQELRAVLNARLSALRRRIG